MPSDEPKSPEVGSPSAELVYESTFSLAWKVVLLQILIALLSAAVVLLLLYVMPVTGAGIVQSVVMPLIIIGLQTMDAAILVYLVLKWQSVRYRITPQGVVIYRGILAVHTTIYRIPNIQEVEVHQSPLGRLFNYGTVSFFNPLKRAKVALVNIPNPGHYARLISFSITDN